MPNEPHQRNYLHGSFETPSTIPPTNPTKTKPLTPKESKSLCLTNMLRSNAGGQGDKERPDSYSRLGHIVIKAETSNRPYYTITFVMHCFGW